MKLKQVTGKISILVTVSVVAVLLLLCGFINYQIIAHKKAKQQLSKPISELTAEDYAAQARNVVDGAVFDFLLNQRDQVAQLSQKRCEELGVIFHDRLLAWFQSDNNKDCIITVDELNTFRLSWFYVTTKVSHKFGKQGYDFADFTWASSKHQIQLYLNDKKNLEDFDSFFHLNTMGTFYFANVWSQAFIEKYPDCQK